ncbi:MAG: tetratricopeptide repeat protein [Flavobacterium psychrophilum]
MKTNKLSFFYSLGLGVLIIACSTKKDTFTSRNSHALSTKYNILYNGGMALEKGIIDLIAQNQDSYWEVLPVERMQISKEAILPGETKINPNFDRAETKATMAIQKHSMNIGGAEKNPQMDEAYLMLGKARYYDQRFVPALEAFNYILYKYPNSDRIYEAKIWREKTNMRMENDALAVTNLTKLLDEIKFKDQIFADANASIAQAYLHLAEKDSAIAKLKLARDFTKSKEEKARYRFIIGQLFEEMGLQDSAFVAYQSVIDMKRKAAREYVVQAHARQAMQFDFAQGDTVAFLKKFNELKKDRENRPFLDVLNHRVALFYDKQKNIKQALNYYNASLKKKSTDQYLVASNYRNMAEIYFYKAKYTTAGKYYDSTMTQLNNRSREFKFIKKKRDNLADVIKYEAIANKNDSIILVYNLSDSDRVAYYEKHIEALKKADEIQKEKDKKAAKSAETAEEASGEKGGSKGQGKTSMAPPSAMDVASTASNFYFYNSSTVAYGKAEFKKNWGNRPYKTNWRVASMKSVDANDNLAEAESEGDAAEDSLKKEKAIDARYTTDFYTQLLPKEQAVIDDLIKERNFAYYQLGLIYKEKFKEYNLASAKLEQLLLNQPEERFILPSMYQLYKIYEITDAAKATAMKDRIINEFPDSRYAKILIALANGTVAATELPNTAYDKVYQLYETGDIKATLIALEEAINQYTGEEIIPKLELLKAHCTGKLMGLNEYKKALNFVALNYPNVEEGKTAESLLATDYPKFEKLTFYRAKPSSWKIVYIADNPKDKSVIKLLETTVKFIKDRSIDQLSTSLDVYTPTKNFFVIHGLKSAEAAKGIVSILRDFKDYKLPNTAYIISNDNYKIVQIKKNFEEYLKTPPSDPIPEVPDTYVSAKSQPNPVMPDQTVPANDILGGDDTENSMAPPSPDDLNMSPDDPSVMKKEKK